MPITSDPERLGNVAGELGAAIRDRQEGKRVRLPVLQRADVAGLTMVLHAELDAAIDERSARAAAMGLTIACNAGCSSCCVSPVLVPEGEAITAAEWLALPENAAVRAGYERRYGTWFRTLGAATVAAFPKATTSDAFHAAAVEVKHKAAMCPFNADGLCSIYPARPALCRKAHALEDNTHCGADGDGNVKYFEHPRTELTYEEQTPFRMAIHHAVRPDAPLDLLAAAVHRLLHANLSRNAPCPCGSGSKYKKCCAA